MTGRTSRLFKLGALCVALAVVGAACGGGGGGGGGEAAANTTPSTVPPVETGPDTTAARVRGDLTGLFTSHAFVAAAAANAALAGSTGEFQGAAASIDETATALAAEISALLDEPPPKKPKVGPEFAALWKKQIGVFTQYVQGLATNNAAQQAQAAADLTAFSASFGSFVNSNLPKVPAATATKWIGGYVTTLKAVVDAHKAGDEAAAYSNLRKAALEGAALADALTAGIATEFPQRVSGDPQSKEADLGSDLRGLLMQDAFLSGLASNGALAGRNADFQGAAAAIEANTKALAGTLEEVFGPKAGKGFTESWKKHIGFLVDYTTGTAAEDQAKKDKAAADLIAFTGEFGKFVNSLLKEVPAEAVAGVMKVYVVTLKTAVDAQASGDYKVAFHTIQQAAENMKQLSTPIVTATVVQLPEKF